MTVCFLCVNLTADAMSHHQSGMFVLSDEICAKHFHIWSPNMQPLRVLSGVIYAENNMLFLTYWMK